MPSRIVLPAVLTIAGMFAEARATRAHETSYVSAPLASTRIAERMRSGPWGRLESERFTLAPSSAALRGMRIGTSPPHWVIPRMTRASFSRLLARASVPDPDAARWVDASRSAEFPEGLGVAPDCGMIRRLGGKGLAAVFAELEKDSANAADRWVLPERYLATLGDFGLPDSLTGSVRAYSVVRGASRVTYCLPCAFGPDIPEAGRTAFLAAMSQQASREVSLRVDARDDLRNLTEYWSVGRDDTGRRRVARLLAEAARSPGGSSVPLESLLPAAPASWLNRFPSSVAAGAKVDTESLNCSWTALNFFRARPEPRFNQATVVVATLTRDYRQVAEPRFGDVAVFLTPDEYLVHAATYVAGDLFFTKNGSNALHPWVLNTRRELLLSFAETLPRGGSLKVRYYRAKKPE